MRKKKEEKMEQEQRSIYEFGFKTQKHKASLNIKLHPFARRLTEGEATRKAHPERLMGNVGIRGMKLASCLELFERKGMRQRTDLEWFKFWITSMQ